MVTPKQLLLNHIEHKRNKKLFKIIFILSLILFIFASQYIYIYTSYADIKPKTYERVYLDVPKFYVPEKKEDCIKLVRDFYCIPHLYFEIEEEPGTNGRTTILPPIVFVDKDLSNTQLILTYAHELTHIKYQTINETFVTFMTFKALYESDNETLHGCGLTLAWRVLYGGYAWTDYDCGYYLIQYFKDEWRIS